MRGRSWPAGDVGPFPGRGGAILAGGAVRAAGAIMDTGAGRRPGSVRGSRLARRGLAILAGGLVRGDTGQGRRGESVVRGDAYFETGDPRGAGPQAWTSGRPDSLARAGEVRDRRGLAMLYRGRLAKTRAGEIAGGPETGRCWPVTRARPPAAGKLGAGSVRDWPPGAGGPSGADPRQGPGPGSVRGSRLATGAGRAPSSTGRGLRRRWRARADPGRLRDCRRRARAGGYPGYGPDGPNAGGEVRDWRAGAGAGRGAKTLGARGAFETGQGARAGRPGAGLGRRGPPAERSPARKRPDVGQGGAAGRTGAGLAIIRAGAPFSGRPGPIRAARAGHPLPGAGRWRDGGEIVGGSGDTGHPRGAGGMAGRPGRGA